MTTDPPTSHVLDSLNKIHQAGVNIEEIVVGIHQQNREHLLETFEVLEHEMRLLQEGIDTARQHL